MANVTFRRGTEANLPSSGMADEGCFFLAEDTGNLYVGDENGNLVPINRSPYYGTCPTEASTNSKVVTIDINSDVFSLSAGTMISVRFANANTAASPTLNVNGSGAIAVKSYGTTAIGDTDDSSWHAGEVVTFIYDGTYWMFVGGMENIQSDWAATTGSSAILNKPSIKSGTGNNSIIECSLSSNGALDSFSHSEGRNTLAFSNSAHAEGSGEALTVLLNSSTDEGSTDKDYYLYRNNYTPIVGNVIKYNDTYATVTAVYENGMITLSDTFGSLTRASVRILTSSAKGVSSHTEGLSTITNNEAEHAEGKYNVSNAGSTNAEKTISSIGIGTDNEERKNAVEVMRNGDVYVLGVGDYDGTNISSASTLREVIENSENVQSNWTNENRNSPSYIQNRPNVRTGIGTGSIIEGDIESNDSSGEYSHSEGSFSFSDGNYSHAEGYASNSKGVSSHSEGSLTVALGTASHAEGSSETFNATFTKVSGEANTYTVSGNNALKIHVGNIVTAGVGVVRRVISVSTQFNVSTIILDGELGDGETVQATVLCAANGASAHTEGKSTMTINEAEHAEGMYNKPSTGSKGSDKTISTIGIGTSASFRKNAIDVRLNGDVYIDKIGGYNVDAEPDTLQDVLSEMQSDIQTISSIQSDWEEEDMSSSSYIQNKPSIKAGIGTDSIEEGSLSTNHSIGTSSHAEGSNRIASGNYSHAEGSGYGFQITISGNQTTYTSSDTPLLKAEYLIVYGDLFATVVSVSKTQFSVSSSLGQLTNAIVNVYADGAFGTNSHVEGLGTIALNANEHAEGKYNVSNQGKEGNTISSIGFGRDNDSRRNAVEVLDDGSVFIYNVGNYDGTNIGSAKNVRDVISTINSSIHSYTIESVSPDTGYLTAYQLKEDGVAKGAKINIPKDMVVSSGEVKTVTVADDPYVGAQVGDKYIDLTIANATTDHLYIPVKDLVDVYTEGNGIDISSGNVISVVVDPNNGLSVGASGVALATATTSSAGAMSAADKTKLEGIANGAEVNQNAFSNVVVGNTTIAADSKTDTLTLEAGSNITLTPDATNDKVTIAASVPSPADANPLMDGTASVGTSTDYAREDHVHPSDTSKVDKVSSSTDNAIVRFDGTGSAIQNSGVTIDDNNYMNVPGRVVIQGSNTSNTTRFITSDSASNIYASVGGVASLVITNSEVRRGSSASSVNLGTSSYPWNNAYAKKFITNGGTSSQLVRGDGSLATISTTDQYEAYLLWGGKNFSGNACSPIDAALVSELGANRSQFLSPTYISVEYSRDGGETWIDYEATNDQKGNLFSVWGLSGLRLGKATTKGEMTSAYMLRVTITDTYNASFYGTYKKFVIYDSTGGATGCYCTIQGRTQANYANSTDTWTTFRVQVGIGGWSGYNVINYATGFTTYGSGAATSAYRQVRFVFGCTGGPSSSYYGFELGKIMCFSTASHTTPSNMARHGHLYNWDRSQNATFPAKVTAPTLCASSKLTVGTDGDVTQYMVYDGKEIVDELGTTYTLNNHYINYSGTWVSSTTSGHYVIPMAGVRMVRLEANDNVVYVTFIKNYVFGNPPTSVHAEGCWGRPIYAPNSEVELVVPSDAEYLFVYPGSKSTQPYKPKSIKLYGSFVTRTQKDDVYYNRTEPLTAEEAVVSDWRNHDVTSLVLSSLIRNGYIQSSTNKYISGSYYSSFIPLSTNISKVKITAGLNNTRIAFLHIDISSNVVVSYAGGTSSILVNAGETVTVDVPNGTLLFYIYLGTLSNNVYSAMPKGLNFTGNRGVENFQLKFGNMSYDGSFETTIPSFTGATTNSNGVEGLVTAPMIADKDKFLKGDGTWAIPEGTLYSDFVGSDDAHAGSSGLVPAPAMSSAPKLLTSLKNNAWLPINSPYLDLCTKTYVDNMIGDIETLLAAI